MIPATTGHQAPKKSRIATTTKPQRIHGHCISLGIFFFFLKENEIRDYFYEMSCMNYESK